MASSTSHRDLWLIFGLALVVRLLAALPQTQPNYMDAAYYLVGGQRLAQGFGFSDPYVWHYLDQPIGLPHPSHLYWMPLPSIMVVLSQSIFGVSYRAAQIPFVLLSAGLPVLAYLIAKRVTAVRRHAWVAALLTIFSPFYLPYWGVPESFAPFAVCGALALYWASGESKWKWLAAGAGVQLRHLAGSDDGLAARLSDHAGDLRASYLVAVACVPATISTDQDFPASDFGSRGLLAFERRP